MRPIKLLSSIILAISLSFMSVKSEIVKNIEILGNERVSNETILMFSDVNINDDLTENRINSILKSLYETNFFKDVSVSFNSSKLSITVIENPIIQSITYNGIKSDTLKEKILKNVKLKSRSSYNEVILARDENTILSSLKELGYYFSKVDIQLVELENNKIDLIFDIDLGNKSKIKKISFIGDKKIKDGKLKSVIISEEYKFWKFISGRKYLNESVINFDKRLLKNYYLNKGYYDVKVNSSFAKITNNDDFELIYNINAGNKFYFDDIKINFPVDFEKSNFEELNNFFQDLKGEAYSINTVEKILDKIDVISTNEQYESVTTMVSENIDLDKISLNFTIKETEKSYVSKINIFGNNITRESVIRNQLYIDEGDPFNEILAKKSVNEIKSLNFFKNVETEILDVENENTKIINITVEEKPTGEISAGAGFGTTGEVIEFAVRENNYLGKGLGVDTALSLGSSKVSGKFNITNPNFNNTDKSLRFGLEALEYDRLTNFGYKSNRIGSSIGTNFEYLDDFRLGLESSIFLEKIETNSTASARQKKQAGNYFDTYLNFDFDYDKRNQKFKTSNGFRSYYQLALPVVSDNNTLKNYYNYKVFSEMYEDNVSTFSLSLSTANSITGDDVKLSERLYVPQSKLRGFVNGKVGPKDGGDFIGGNYFASMNFSSSLPQILPNAQNIDVISFLDMANLWGVDDNSLNDGSEIRSSVGVAIDWYTVVGPLSFSFAAPITKSSTDKTETFRFNLGTTF
jgi:outer membrane protein insertion porin family